MSSDFPDANRLAGCFQSKEASHSFRVSPVHENSLATSQVGYAHRSTTQLQALIAASRWRCGRIL